MLLLEKMFCLKFIEDIDQGYSITSNSSNNIIVTEGASDNADLNGDGTLKTSGYRAYDIFISKFTN